MGAGLHTAATIGQAWSQDAIVWCGADAVPELILTRPGAGTSNLLPTVPKYEMDPLILVFVDERTGRLSLADSGVHGAPSDDDAMRFFEQLDGDDCELLGVDIVEGEHPGSSYYAAELTLSVEEANAIAEQLGLRIYFKVL